MIKVIEDTFQGIDLAACISLVDNDGLVIHSIGECADQWILESMNAYLISAFEATLTKLLDLNQVLDSLVITTDDSVFYIDDLRGRNDLYVIIRTSQELMNKVLPFLKSFVRAIEMGIKDLG